MTAAGPSPTDTVTEGLAARAEQLAQAPLIEVRPRRPWQDWNPRQLVAAVALAPVTAWFFHSAAGSPGWSDPAWVVATVALAVMGALVWATYLPAARRASGRLVARSSPCARVAGFHVIAAGMLLSLNPTLLMVVPAFAIQAMALHQRTTGACATR